MDWLKCILCFLLLSPLAVQAQQDSLSPALAEETSYTHYIHQEWQALADFSELAIQSGIDSYYLRLRTGIAYFKMEQYHNAIPYLETAARMNPFEFVANDYLYWCYMYCNRNEEALRLAAKLSIKINQPVIQSTFTEAGTKLSADRTLAYNLHYTFAGIQHRVKKHFTLFHGVTYLQQETHWGNYTQYQYYMKGRIPLKYGWYANPAVHLTQLYAAPYNKGLYSLGHLGLEKFFRKWNIQAGYVYSDFFNQYQHQMHVQLTWLPFKKNVGWISCAPAFQVSQQDGKKILIGTQAGYVFRNRSVIQINNFIGNARNFSETNGFLINNTLDRIQHRYSLQYSYPLSAQKEIYLITQYEGREEFVYQKNLTYYGIIIGYKFKPLHHE